jgi:hypothetical protein
MNRVQSEVRSLAGRSPRLCQLLLKRGEFVTAETEICIEGFQRSGNTFAVIAFQFAQPRIVSIAHHVHAPASILTATRLGTPALVLIRPPEGTIISCVIRWPHLTIGQALRAYGRFYRPLLACRDRIVVARFQDIIEDYGKVIRELNGRFRTGFDEFVHSKENVRQVYEELDGWDRNALGHGEHFERARARPTEAREDLKVELQLRYRRPRHDRLRAQAEELYQELAEPSPGA